VRRSRFVSPGEIVSAEVYEKALRDGLKEKFPKWDKDKKAKKNFSPSGIGFGKGKCPRYWVYLFQGGLDHEELGDHKSMLKRMTGTSAHADLQALVETQLPGMVFEDKVISNDPPIFGYVDIYDPEHNVPVEIKNVDSVKFSKAKDSNIGEESHVIQTLIYMWVKGAKQGVLLYVDRTTLDTHAFSIIMNEHHEKWIEGLINWMKIVYKAYQEDQLPHRPFAEDSVQCKWCPIKKACWADREGDVFITSVKDLGYR
jgi:CRISPR/Cas system-associated exonuclease Cas4 (RecB family)